MKKIMKRNRKKEYCLACSEMRKGYEVPSSSSHDKNHKRW